MRRLGEQWVEDVYGKMHILNAVENPYESCQGCALGCESYDVFHYCLADGGKCPVNKMDMVIKDLGILNEDGLLPCPFCGEYPTIKEELDENDERIYSVEHECTMCITTGWNHDKQEVIDAWNRRS